MTPTNAPPLLAGAGFGTVFYAVAYGVLAPVLGLRPAMWIDARANVAQRGFFHLLFGLLVGWLMPAIGVAHLHEARSTLPSMKAGGKEGALISTRPSTQGARVVKRLHEKMDFEAEPIDCRFVRAHPGNTFFVTVLCFMQTRIQRTQSRSGGTLKAAFSEL